MLITQHIKEEELEHQLTSILSVKGRVDVCLEALRTYDYIILLESKHLNWRDLEFLYSFFPDTRLFHTDVIGLVNDMAYASREQSHGAAVLEKVYLPESLYNSIVEKAGLTPGVTCKVGGVVLYPNKNVKPNTVIGLCRPKFPGMPARQLIILGEINATE